MALKAIAESARHARPIAAKQWLHLIRRVLKTPL